MTWRFNKKQLEAVASIVKEQDVLDLGAHNLEGSELMVELGARSVLAVDRNLARSSSSKITTRQCYFHQLEETRPVVLASWIVNWDVNIDEHLAAATYIISVSKNTDHSACGYARMWEYLRRREVLEYIPARSDVLTIYGPAFVDRPITGEELAGLMPMKLFTFEEAENEARKNPGLFGAGAEEQAVDDRLAGT